MDEGWLVRQLCDETPDLVFHLAAQSNVPVSFDDPISTFSTNVLGTINLLEAIRKCSPRARIVIPSSANAYGTVPEDQLPIGETTPLKPSNPYASSKAAQEIVALQYHRAFNLDIVIARCFNILGPGQSTSFAIPAFAAQLGAIARGEQPCVVQVGMLDVERDVVDVDDAGRAFALLGERAATGEAYNICTGIGLSMARALDILIELSGLDVRVERDPARLRPAENPRLIGDPAKIREKTGWHPTVPIRETLRGILAHHLTGATKYSP